MFTEPRFVFRDDYPTQSTVNAPLIVKGYASQASAAQHSVLFSGQGGIDFRELPFCNIYMVFFFLGLFFSPFLICGLIGLCSKKIHEYWAGRLSVIMCVIHIVGLIIYIPILIWFIKKEKDLSDDYDSYIYGYSAPPKLI